MRFFSLIVLGTFLAAAARADVVHFKTGGWLEGKVSSEDGDRMVIETRHGRITVSRSQVLRVERRKTVVETYEEKLASIPEKDVPGRLALARWCQQHKLGVRRRQLLGQVLALDKNNAEARGLLGYVRHEGKWLTVEERNRALGLVKFEGRWLKPQAIADIKIARERANKAELERRRSELEVELKRAELEKLRAERRRLDAQSAVVTAEKERLESEAARISAGRAKLEAEAATLAFERRRLGKCRRTLRGLPRKHPRFREVRGKLYYYPQGPAKKKRVLIADFKDRS